MDNSMEILVDNLYSDFLGKTGNGRVLVRNGKKEDAFELVVLKILYEKILGIAVTSENIEEIANYVIAPPDSGIDIFVQKGNGDDQFFDVIQVKTSELDEAKLKEAMLVMERTIADFCKNPVTVKSESCREVLSKSDLEKSNKSNCQYYIVHTGETRTYSGIRDNEHILNLVDLHVLQEGNQERVEKDEIVISGKDNYLEYGQAEDETNAILCNVNAYDLAELCNRYYSTEIGRNILFGHNLREALDPRKSKSYGVMKKTIEDCPENFWYYNNGITMIAETVKPIEKDEQTTIAIEGFSIVNGAQTTSSLGLMLQYALRDRDESVIENLKKAYVMTRILRINDEETQNAVAIYNNTQNRIDDRDMVSTNIEQKKLHESLLDAASYPQIFVEIRRGSKLPNSFNKVYTHRKTSNEILAQLAYAGFYLKPYNAKDKKSALFFNDTSQSEFTLNEIYHRIFNYDADDDTKSGILFRKSKIEIDELLFVQQLYKDGKNYLRKIIQNRLEKERESYDIADPEQKASIMPRIERDEAMLETIGVCQFYFIAAYYEFYSQNPTLASDKRYDFEKYYQDKTYKEYIVSDSANFFLMKTIEIINKTAKENGKATNMNNWIRGAACEKAFFESLRNDIGYDISLVEKFERFIEKYKVVPV